MNIKRIIEVFGCVMIMVNPLASSAQSAPVDTTKIVKVVDYAYKMETERNLPEAAHYYAIAVKLASTDIERASLNYQLGNVLQDLKKNVEAQDAYKEAVGFYNKVNSIKNGGVDEELAATLNDLGNSYYYSKMWKEADKILSEADSVRTILVKKSPVDYEPLLGRTLYNLANVQYQEKKLSEAFANYNRAKDIAEKYYATDSTAYKKQIAMILNNLGALSMEMNDKTFAEECYKKLLNIYNSNNADNGSKYILNKAIAYDNLGGLYLDQKRYEEAGKMLNAAVMEYKKLGNDKAYENRILSILTLLSVTNYSMKNYAEAIPTLEYLAEIYEKNGEKELLADTYKRLAKCYIYTSAFPKAEAIADKAIALGGAAADEIKADKTLAVLLQGRYDEAKDLYSSVKNKIMSNGNVCRQYIQAFLGDLAGAGIISPEMAKKDVKKFKKLINK